MALLSATRNHRHSVLAQEIYDRMKLLFSKQKKVLISASVLLSNTYSMIGDHQQAKQIRDKRINELGLKTQAGITWSEVNGELLVMFLL